MFARDDQDMALPPDWLSGDRVAIDFPDDGVIVNVVVTQIADTRLRLDSVPVMVESAGYRDIIETERLDETTFRFLKLVEKSDWKIYEFYMLEEQLKTPAVQKAITHVLSEGGVCEVFLGGCMVVCLPPNCTWDPTPEIESGDR